MFTCLGCGVYTTHEWDGLIATKFSGGVQMSECDVPGCEAITRWVDNEMVYPYGGVAPSPHSDLSEGPRADYDEAAAVSGRSPRAAAALLRVCIERLVEELEPGKGDLNVKIGLLVSKGLR